MVEQPIQIRISKLAKKRSGCKSVQNVNFCKEAEKKDKVIQQDSLKRCGILETLKHLLAE